jgi:hypothetical protein
MAVRFRNTEVFRHPISLACMRHYLSKHSQPSQLQSPHRISSSLFSDLYQTGRGLAPR